MFVASVDDNVGRVLDYLDENDLTDDTIVVYTSDQVFSAALQSGLSYFEVYFLFIGI